MDDLQALSDAELEAEAEQWIAEGMELIRRWDAGDRSPEVVAFISEEGIVERRELERQRVEHVLEECSRDDEE